MNENVQNNHPVLSTSSTPPSPDPLRERLEELIVRYKAEEDRCLRTNTPGDDPAELDLRAKILRRLQNELTAALSPAAGKVGHE